ncbi:uncharacterized protein LODBEIA_P52130 [Lodderomyces beijingensis]|uniref:Exocyst complex component Sec3 PIP2-binding N-terminal domain-containing protein n=1 Tax=Lodderomyces beijingensis TaxID=1775926 RepID=A0ABP0ZSA9_9ASCO
MFKSPLRTKSKSSQEKEAEPTARHPYYSRSSPVPPSSQQIQSQQVPGQQQQSPYGSVGQFESTKSQLPPINTTSPARQTLSSAGQFRPMSPASPSVGSGQSNSEQERKRATDKIINDCYSKTIQVGEHKVHDTAYIAHIGILEYTHSTSAPPRNEAEAASFKQRILVLCKKNSGKVMLQKGKFSEDRHLYQIGRDWDLAELSTIKRVGSDGMILKLNKDYYWRTEEEDSRVWKFCRYVCQEYGSYMGRYPNLEGFSLDDFMISGPPKSPAPISLARFPPKSPTVAGNFPPPRTAQPSSPTPPSEHKSKSLKQKIMQKPSLFSSDKSPKKTGSPTLTPASSSTQTTPNTHKKTSSAGSLYKNMDFTVNGQLPKKAMKVISRDKPTNVSSNPLELTNPTSGMAQANQFQGSKQSTPSVHRESPHSQNARRSVENPAGSRASADSLLTASSEKGKRPQSKLRGNEDARSLASNESHSFIFGLSDPKENNQNQEKLQQQQQQQDKKAELPGSYRSMIPMETLDERTKTADTAPQNRMDPIALKTRTSTKPSYKSMLPAEKSEPQGLDTGRGVGGGSRDQNFFKSGYQVQDATAATGGGGATPKSPEEAIQEFGESLNPPRKMAASARSPDFGIEEITDESDTEQKPKPPQQQPQPQRMNTNKRLSNSIRELRPIITNESQELRSHVRSGSNLSNPYATNQNEGTMINESSRYDDVTLRNQEPSTNAKKREAGLNIYTTETQAFLGESTTLDDQNKIDSHMRELENLLDSHIMGAANNLFEEEPQDKLQRANDFAEATSKASSGSKIDLNHVGPEQKPPSIRRGSTKASIPTTVDSIKLQDSRGHDDHNTERGLNIRRKSEKAVAYTDSVPAQPAKQVIKPVLTVEPDPETEEFLKELGWSAKMDSETFLKSLIKELGKTKRETVNKLVSVDLTSTLANDVEVASGEIENVLHTFQRMDVRLKTLRHEVGVIDEDSKGLQLKFVNKKLLYNSLNGAMSQLSINGSHLQEIVEFRDFDRLDQIGELEVKLLSLYSALMTTRTDQNQTNADGDLGSLRALQQHRSQYEKANQRFVRHFCLFILNEFERIANQLNQDVDNFSLSTFIGAIGRLLTYSGITYYVREIDALELSDINQRFNETFAKVLQNMLMAQVRNMKSQKSSAYSTPKPDHPERFSPSLSRSKRSSLSPRFASAFEELDDEDDIIPLRKGRSTRFGRKPTGRFGDASNENDYETKKKARLDALKQQMMGQKSSHDIEDSKAVVALIEESKIIIMFLQFFMITFFHYEVSDFVFAEYLQNNPFSERRKMTNISKSNIADIINANGNNLTISNDVINNLNMVLGSYIGDFSKNIHPTELNKPVILWQLEQMTKSVQETYLNHEYLLYNFLKKVSDQYQAQWKKYVGEQIEAVNDSIIGTRAGVLPAVKKVSFLLLITETSFDNRDVRGSATRSMIDQAYDRISDSLVHLFSREDPLMKGRSMDGQEREFREVSTVENIFYILQQASELTSTNSTAAKKLTDKLTQVFKKNERSYFQHQLGPSFGPLVDFIESHKDEQQGSKGHKSKKHAKQLLSRYSEHDIKTQVGHIHARLEQHFTKTRESDAMFTKDLMDRLWLDLETVFIDYFTRLGKVLRYSYDRDLEYNVGRQDIHHIFKSVRDS